MVSEGEVGAYYGDSYNGIKASYKRKNGND